MTRPLELQKCKQACEILQELDIDAWLIWVRETAQMADPVLKLVLGSDLVWQSALIFTKDGEKIAIVGNFDADGIEDLKLFDQVSPYIQSIRKTLLAELERINPRQIALNYSRNDVAADGLTVGMRMLFEEYLEGTPFLERFVSAESIISKLRGRKISAEITRIRKAIEITEQIFADAVDYLRVGLTEKQIHKFFHQKMKEYGVTSAWEKERNPAVDAGPNKQFGHAGPTENKTKAGQLLHFDFGVSYQGFCSDIQRMFFFGEKRDIPEEVQTAFETVRDAITAASKFVKAGIMGHEADAIARSFVQERGYEEYQHALGHQVGRNVHDGGTLLAPLWDRYGESPRGTVEVGNVFTLELYVTTENFGQVSLEENIVITKTGCRFLSEPQRELICIPPKR
ncbi:MAG: M24 family metallopeptidase [Promethearchaeota archaeon]